MSLASGRWGAWPSWGWSWFIFPPAENLLNRAIGLCGVGIGFLLREHAVVIAMLAGGVRGWVFCVKIGPCAGMRGKTCKWAPRTDNTGPRLTLQPCNPTYP
jgi:hypothetical protein